MNTIPAQLLYLPLSITIFIIMSRKIGKLYHPLNNHPEEIYEGFSWPCLLFGFMWYLVKGMFGWAIINFLVAGFTFGISLLIFPFFANNHRKESLLKKGYLANPKED